MKYMTNKTLQSSLTRIINAKFKDYKRLPSNQTLISKANIIYRIETNEKIYFVLYNDYKERINNYIKENFKDFKKQ